VTINEILDDVERLTDEAVQSDNPRRHRAGMEAHMKLQRAADEIKVSGTDADRERAHALAERLVTEVFKVDA
jgi:hypothetical protein